MPKVPYEENKLYSLKVILASWCISEVIEDVIPKRCTAFFENINSVTQTLVYT